MSKCPICYREQGIWKKDPILLPNGTKYKWSNIEETTLVEVPEIKDRIYKGIYQISNPEVQELQDSLKTLELENLNIGDRTTFTSFINPGDNTAKFQITGAHLKEMRDSIEKLLVAMGLTKTDYFNYDEDGNHIIHPLGDKLDWTDPIVQTTDLQKFQIKAIHIEDLRRYINVIRLEQWIKTVNYLPLIYTQLPIGTNYNPPVLMQGEDKIYSTSVPLGEISPNAIQGDIGKWTAYAVDGWSYRTYGAGGKWFGYPSPSQGLCTFNIIYSPIAPPNAAESLLKIDVLGYYNETFSMMGDYYNYSNEAWVQQFRLYAGFAGVDQYGQIIEDYAFDKTIKYGINDSFLLNFTLSGIRPSVYNSAQGYTLSPPLYMRIKFFVSKIHKHSGYNDDTLVGEIWFTDDATFPSQIFHLPFTNINASFNFSTFNPVSFSTGDPEVLDFVNYDYTWIGIEIHQLGGLAHLGSSQEQPATQSGHAGHVHLEINKIGIIRVTP